MEEIDLAIIDVETTGTSAAYDRVIEVGLLKVEKGAIVSTYSTFVDPERHIPYYIEKLTGITNEDVAGAPTFRDIKDKLLELLDGSVLVAHNARFDYGFIRNEFERERVDFSARCLCTARLSRKLFPEYRRHNLDSIIERFGLSCVNRHRALDDAQVLWEFIQILRERFQAADLQSAIRSILKAPALLPHLDESMVTSLPEAPGVYAFYGENGNPLYVGKSVNVRSRVRAHFVSDRHSSREMALCQQVTNIQVTRTSGELGALLLESNLIKELCPLYNRRSLNPKKMVLVKKVMNERYLTTRLEHFDSPLPDDLSNIIGIFRSMKQAKDFIWSVAKEHGLCPRILGLEKVEGACFYKQLRLCRGACTGDESAADYNRRFLLAFAGQGIRPWPFAGPVVVEERNGDGTEGEAFLIDHWCLIGSLTFDETGAERFLKGRYLFDYDSYKILVNHLLGPASRPRVRQISRAELNAILERFN